MAKRSELLPAGCAAVLWSAGSFDLSQDTLRARNKGKKRLQLTVYLDLTACLDLSWVSIVAFDSACQRVEVMF